MIRTPLTLLLLALLTFISTGVQGGKKVAAGDLTPPFLVPGIGTNSWFDHNWPGLLTSGYLPFDRYDGSRFSSTAALLQNCTPGNNCYNGHEGTDYGVSMYTPIVAAAGGTVVIAKTTDEGGLGKHVRIWHPSLGYSTVYGHLDSISVSVGQQVPRRHQVGLSGTTGNSSAPHLHFEARNQQSSGQAVDINGWAGAGQDPDAPGLAYGHLMAIRMGRLTGGSLYIKDGGLSEQWLFEYSGVTSYSMTANRIGVIAGGVPKVKDGPWDAQWVDEYASASRLALSGRRIAIISNGTALVKQGALNEQWTSYGSGFSEIAVAHGEQYLPERVGLLAGNLFFVSEGSLGTTPTLVATNAKAIALGAGWIGYIDTNNTAWAKSNLLGARTQIDTNVSSLVMAGSGDDRRLGVIRLGVAKVKEDSLSSNWVTQMSGVTKLDLNSGRVAVLKSSGEALVKEVGLSDQWTSVYPSASDIRLN